MFPVKPINTAVVLGGTGWVGRHLCAALAERGARIVVVARGKANHLPCHRFLSMDLTAVTCDATAELLHEESADLVLNCTDAANATDGWDRTEAELLRVNVSLVNLVLESVKAQPRPTRLVHIGTMHEYAPVAAGTSIDEYVPCIPESAYARSKLAGSQAVIDAAGTNSVDGLVLRASNICGPFPSRASLPGKLVSLLSQGTMRLPIADAYRDWLDVRDLARAAVAAAERPGLTGVINVGSGRTVSTREFVETFVRAANLPLSMIEDTFGDIDSYGGSWMMTNVQKAAEHLDWRPQHSLYESLRDMWETR